MTVKDTWSFRLFALAVGTALCVLIVVPLVWLAVDSVRTDQGFSLASYREVLGTSRQWGLLGNSLAIAGGSTLLAAVLGIPAALALTNCGHRWRPILWAGVATAVLTPPYVMAIGWIDLLGRAGLLSLATTGETIAETSVPRLFSAPGVIFVHGLCFYPVVAAALRVGLRRYDQRFSDAAALSHGRLREFLSIRWPMLAPWVMAGSLCVFLLCLVSCAVPSLLQVNTYPVEIYSTISAFYDFPGALAQGLPLMACGGALLLVWALWVRPRQAWLTGARRADMGEGRRGRAARILSITFCTSLIAVTAGLPFGALVVRALPLRSFLEAWLTARQEIAASLLTSGLAATFLTMLAFAMAYLEHKKAPLAWAYPACILAFLVSGPLLGRSLILTWNHHGLPGMIFDSTAIVIIACTAKFLFFAHQGSSAAFRETHEGLEEPADLAGIPWWREMSTLFLPLHAPALGAVWGLSFLLSLREVDVAVMVAPPGVTPLSIRVFTLMHYGPAQVTAALSLLVVALLLVAGALTAILYSSAKDRLHATH